VVRSEGEGPGGIAGTIRFDGSGGGTAALERMKAGMSALADTARMPRITGAHLCLTNSAASAARTVESENRPDVVTAPIGVVLIEGCDEKAVRAAVLELSKQCGLDGAPLQIGTYALEHVRNRSAEVQ
jgi:hypothetical protein